MRKNVSWMIFWIATSFICIVTSIVVYGKINPPKPQSDKCNIPDTYGYHAPGSIPVRCDDVRQELKITREGTLMGHFEYRCHCK